MMGWNKWTSVMLAAILIILTSDKASCMKTSPPDEIIEILRSGDYNKHHLPTYAASNTTLKTNRTLHGPNEWTLMMEHYQKIDYDRIRLIQKDKTTPRSTRIVMNKAVAKEMAYHITQFIDHYVTRNAGPPHGSRLSHNRSGLSSEYSSSSAERDRQNLISAEIRADRVKAYFIRLLRTVRGDESLLVTEVRGRVRRLSIVIPVSQWQNVSDTLEEFVEAKYDTIQGPPTYVSIGMYIEGMSSFRAETMDFHVDIYFYEIWEDLRLQHSSEYPVLLRDMGLYEEMWHPDLYFANAKEAKYHNVTAANFLLYIFPNGSIYLDIRISLVLNCMMDLSHYPLDQQECFIRILSYAYDKDNLDILWKPMENITKNEDIKLPDMELVKYEAQYCDGTYAIGIWSCARASFKMKREIMHHILQSYIPTALIVIISWFSFWLDVSAVPGRVSLCITTLLTLATQAQAAKMSLPQVSYAKAIDVWMGVCMGFVFGVMIEFTGVNYISRRTSTHTAPPPGPSARKRARTLNPAANYRLSEFNNLFYDVTGTAIGPPPNSDSNVVYQKIDKDTNGYAVPPKIPDRANGEEQQQSTAPPLTQEQQQQALKNKQLAVAVDRASRFVFPCSFLLFNLLYWPYYLLPRM